MNREEKIALLKKIQSGQLSKNEAFPIEIDLDKCSVDELNLLLNLKKKAEKHALTTEDLKMWDDFIANYKMRVSG